MTPLSVFLQTWLSSPARWGESDCCISVLDWVSAVKGGDLAEDLRLTYDDFSSAQKVSRFFTHPLIICTEYFQRRAGLPRATIPQRGDVGVYKWPGHDGRILPTAGICIGAGQFAARSAPGDGPGIVACRPERLIAVWSVGYRDDTFGVDDA